MPARGQKFDFMLGTKGFMLARRTHRGRAWRRTGQPNAVKPLVADADAQRSGLPPEVDFVAAYDDFSGGYGHAYRQGSRPNTIHWSENVDLRWPNQAVHCQRLQTLPDNRYGSLNTRVDYMIDVPVPSANAQPAGAGAVLLMGRDIVGRLSPTGFNTAGSQFDGAAEFVVGASLNMRYQPAVAQNFTYIPFAAAFARRTHDAAYTLGGDPGGARSFVTAGNRLWRNHSVFMLQNAPIGQSVMSLNVWSATLNIGNQNDGIMDMIELNDQIYAGLADGLYAGDTSGTFYNVLPELRNSRNEDNARDLTIYDNSVIVPHVGGLFAYHPADIVAQATEIGPRARSSDRSPIQGRIRAVRSQGPWLYAGLWTGSQSFLQAGRPEPNGEWRWHVLHRLPHTARVNRIHFDTITNASGNAAEIPTRMWVSTDGSISLTATAPLYVAPIPRLNGNPLVSDPVFVPNYVGSARVDLGRDNRGAPETLKVLRRVDVNTDASTFLSGSRYADVYYTLDGGGRTLLGRAQTSPRTTLYFSSGEGSFVTCYDFELSLESFTAQASMCPIYRSIVLHGAFLTEGTDEIVAVVDVATGRADRDGTPMRPSAVQLAELRSMAGEGPQVLTDLTGGQHWVTVQRGITEEETYEEGSDDPEIAAGVRMVVIDFG